MRDLILKGLAAAMLLAAAPAALAATDADKAQSRAIIDRQIDAFRHDDAAAAFGFASPALQQMFGDADRFMAMVKTGFPPVYRPKDYAFVGIKETDEGLTDTVAITDADGQAWTAVYTLAQQPDGSWKITSCHLEKAALSA